MRAWVDLPDNAADIAKSGLHTPDSLYEGHVKRYDLYLAHTRRLLSAWWRMVYAYFLTAHSSRAEYWALERPYLVARTLWFDQQILNALARPQAPKQVVLLGAGMDSRAQRL